MLCFSKAILSYSIMSCSVNPMAVNESLYSFSAYHRASVVTSVVFFTCLFQHLFRLVVHPLSFRRSEFGTATVGF